MKEQCSLSEAAVPGNVSSCQQCCTAVTRCLHGSFLPHRGKLAWLLYIPEQSEEMESAGVLLPIALNMTLCEHWAMLRVAGWGKRKNKCKTASQAHCTVPVMSVWISQESCTRVCRALLLSLIWITLYVWRIWFQAKAWKCYVSLFFLPQRSITVDSMFIFLDFSCAFTS